MGAIITPMRHNRGRLLPVPCQAARAPQRGAGWRPGPPNPSSCDRARHHEPACLGKAGCPDPLSPPADDPRDPNPRLEPPAQNPTLPADTFPPRRLILPRDRQPPQERLRRRCASAARLLTRAARPQTTAAIRAGRRMGHAPKPLRNRSATPKPDRLTSGPDTGRGLREALAAEKSAEVDALAAEAARALGCENGLETAEAVLRAGLLRLGGAMLGEALSADPGHRGPRADCRHGHEAGLAGHREKVI